jgi:hypothetical protein
MARAAETRAYLVALLQGGAQGTVQAVFQV